MLVYYDTSQPFFEIIVVGDLKINSLESKDQLKKGKANKKKFKLLKPTLKVRNMTGLGKVTILFNTIVVLPKGIVLNEMITI